MEENAKMQLQVFELHKVSKDNFYKSYEYEFEILVNRNFTIKINNIKKIRGIIIIKRETATVNKFNNGTIHWFET